jgi:D-cysteine desulfhydrase
MAELAGAKGYVIPEGGSNALGSQGYIRAARELAAQDAHGFDSVVCAVGSGGTVAGLAMGLNGGRLVGMAVCDDAAFFEDRVGAIASEAGKAPQVEWRIDDRYRGSAYAVASQEVWGTIRLVAQLEGLLLDPVYTGKAMHGLLAELKAGRMSGRILFWHTGGAFGLFGRGAEAV